MYRPCFDSFWEKAIFILRGDLWMLSHAVRIGEDYFHLIRNIVGTIQNNSISQISSSSRCSPTNIKPYQQWINYRLPARKSLPLERKKKKIVCSHRTFPAKESFWRLDRERYSTLLWLPTQPPGPKYIASICHRIHANLEAKTYKKGVMKQGKA